MNVNVQFEVVSDFSQISDDDNVLFLVDDVLPKAGDKEGGINPIGRATIGGQVAAVEQSKGFNKSTIFHELGHNLGLEFENNPSDPAHSKDTDHLMYYRTGGNKLNSSDLDKVWNFLSNAGDGTYDMGTGNARKEASEFINNGSFKVNQEKKNETNTP